MRNKCLRGFFSYYRGVETMKYGGFAKSLTRVLFYPYYKQHIDSKSKLQYLSCTFYHVSITKGDNIFHNIHRERDSSKFKNNQSCTYL